MTEQRKSLFDFSVEELDQEIIARAAQSEENELFHFRDKEGTPCRDEIMTSVKKLHEAAPPRNEELDGMGTPDLVKALIFKADPAMDFTRNTWAGTIMDEYEIWDKQILNNTGCVAAVCLKDDLQTAKKGISILKTKNYGETFNLDEKEPFLCQPVAAGPIGTGFLVKEDVIATAAHVVNKNNITGTRFLFGYRMQEEFLPVLEFANENIYSGVKIINQIANPYGGDWVLVKLDRKVEEQPVVSLYTGDISFKQEVYVIGHPRGLPLKFAKGMSLRKIENSYFAANINIYSGSPGSPVFDLHTHQVIGMVVRSHNHDFRWTGKGWRSINFSHSKRVDCPRVPGFIDGGEI
jgi:hypothetical protein